MRPTRYGTLFLGIAAIWCAAHAHATADAPAEELKFASLAVLAGADNQDDPGYTMYKDGYNLILEEKWPEARKKFSELLAKYPKSDYVDDAEYWSAYAMMHVDRVKARVEYKKFLEKNNGSTYYDDAIADLMSMEGTPAPTAIAEGPESLNVHVRVPNIKIWNPVAPNLRDLSSNMRRMRWNVRRMGHDMRSMSVAPTFGYTEEKELDQNTKIKLSAIEAIGELKEDDRGFTTLKGIALDKKQHFLLREAAMRQLSDYKLHDVSSVFLDIARNDTSEEMQTAAITHLRESGKDKGKTLETLAGLYNTLPKQRAEQRSAILYEIADIGNDKAVDFLVKVAESDSDYDLRGDAVYYLGNIGGDKARTALYNILENK